MSTSRNRLAEGGRIERTKTLAFTFNGRRYTGFKGDTLASALLANGVKALARSFKYHRPRGLYSAGVEEPNAVVQLENGARTRPNLQATEIELYDGLSAKSVNCWPSVEFDIGAVNSLAARLLPAGFYYKTFMWPKSFWMAYERIIRNAAGLGTAPKLPDPDTYDKMHEHADVLVVGGGPSGLAAALAAGRSGARVILADQEGELGGRLLSENETIDGKPAVEWIEDATRELTAMEDVRVLTRTTAFGYYDQNYLGLVERRHIDVSRPVSHSSERLWRVRAKQVVLATGSIERPLVFANNDRPGVMLAGALRSYVIRYGVSPGKKAVIFTNNDDAYRSALALDDAGITVAAVVDLRNDPDGSLVDAVRARDISVLDGWAITAVLGKMAVKAVEISELSADGDNVVGPSKRIDCDVLGSSGGWNPVVHLHSQSGGKARFDETIQSFVPGVSVQKEQSAGTCAGTFPLKDCLKGGYAAGKAAAKLAGFSPSRHKQPVADALFEAPLQALWVVPTSNQDDRAKGFGAKHFVDIHSDVTVADIELAAREGYQSVEHVKRYTALGMGPDQGKTGNIPGMAVLGQALDQPIADVGTTTFRPPFTPVTYGALAGRDIGEFSDPARQTAMHHWHEQAGALFEDVGQWKRPWYYPKPGETMQDALNRECLAARNAIGILDASTLGKIDIQGPDAAEFINRIYTNAWMKLGIGKCRYGLMLGEDGMVMDDGVTARLGDNHFHMTTTTGNAAQVLGWLEEWLQTEWPELQVYCNSVTEYWSTMTICGPRAGDLMAEFTTDIDLDTEAFPFMSFKEGTVGGIPARVFRISFTGELSYEINVPANMGLALWTALMNAGEKYGITPYGTETMHILRAEKGYIIVGQETDGTMTPLDLGMDWIVSKKKDFIGRRSLNRADCVREGRKQLVGLLTTNPADVLPEGAQLVSVLKPAPPMDMIGHVTSSYYSATLGRSIALAVVKDGRNRMGETIHAPMEDKTMDCEIVDPVFFDKEGSRIDG
ncbi:MAG: sarcosine oxidase subunit alpha family protein [Rhodospirillaceae bacterium]|jgi:sarcosine oxidase, subunit alpha|nr:sarcosine oxidase subunit alpha family protein [Rhodospirillaceae bacterium]MBT5244567.1 sarcosine oxidase subunit alpha family protein [Rhodospirillaceae bacterium]MBT5563477.1 sarcosine oxidase subunit alpha family protein [Rhodospirillaceae bacterium]MBT6240792.1 sarcosine oxidase subunit alpha family protein [Rhodospirillaceae bacterium]MBT7137798.1 sarcosine oxidase subunit alpha family protein [Rhodospirillaceae bacterium]